MNKVKPKTAVGRFLDKIPEGVESNLGFNVGNSFFKEKSGEKLIFELPSKKKIKFIPKLVDPKQCTVWAGNIRLQEFLSEENVSELKNKIQAQGQLIPVMARPTKNNKDFTHEVIYGSRRLYVCSLLGIDIKILEADIDDNDALIFMDAENAGRENVSCCEEARAYKHWLDQGIFKSQGELAEKMGITRPWLNKILSLNKLPQDIIAIMGGPQKLSVKLGSDILKYISTVDNNKIKTCIEGMVGKQINEEQAAQLIFKLTKDKTQSKKLKLETKIIRESFSRVLYNQNKEPVCKITCSKQGKSTVTFNNKVTSAQLDKILKEIEVAVKNIL
jgi:ParB/RepB/Spo0J family partition protein